MFQSDSRILLGLWWSENVWAAKLMECVGSKLKPYFDLHSQFSRFVEGSSDILYEEWFHCTDLGVSYFVIIMTLIMYFSRHSVSSYHPTF